MSEDLNDCDSSRRGSGTPSINHKEHIFLFAEIIKTSLGFQSTKCSFAFLAWCECKASQAQAKCSRLYILNVIHLNIKYSKYGGILKTLRSC